MLEKFINEFRVRAGEFEKDSFRRFFHAVEVRADALALAVALAGDLFLVWQNTGRASHIYKEIATFNALDRTRYDFSLPRAVFGHHTRLLRLADFLDNHLFRGLRGDAPVVAFAFKRENDFIIHHRVLLYLLCVVQHNMMLGVEVDALVRHVAFALFLAHFLHFGFGNDARLVHHDFYLMKRGRARGEVKCRADNLAFLAVLFLVGGRERRFNGFHDFPAGNPALLLKLVKDGMYYFEVKHICHFQLSIFNSQSIRQLINFSIEHSLKIGNWNLIILFLPFR